MKDENLDQASLYITTAALACEADGTPLPEALLPFDIGQYGATGRHARKVERRSNRRRRQRQTEWRARSRRT